jgi:hypothetical protein
LGVDACWKEALTRGWQVSLALREDAWVAKLSSVRYGAKGCDCAAEGSMPEDSRVCAGCRPKSALKNRLLISCIFRPVGKCEELGWLSRVKSSSAVG